jgi:hypothetical protein
MATPARKSATKVVKTVKKLTTKPLKANPVGRPSSYKPEYADMAGKFALLGASDVRMAELFGVSVVTFDAWKKKFPEFLGSLKAGKDFADANVASSLYHRALGYEHEEDDIRALNGQLVITPTIKRYPPDTGAATLWLKNRQPHIWRDKVENVVTGADGGPIEHNHTLKFVDAK